ncbi:DUF1924 domain-containing protein [Aromatoleum diolicum]|uniref:DUF1924 domain-containing protein n=1 Tax=Aromatoleum diolicum TaxID=75796 RepID=A0ABX1QDL0_9RHOO|nr:DUF1924 domain-containing protein [Aromatoleum diolicum]NMG75269.1 DUF1924 domain-containing protein [Aromatoleum diolicum]
MTLSHYAIAFLCALGLANTTFAGPRDALLERYAMTAKAAEPAFAGFSANRGEALHRTEHAKGKADTPACTSCHGPNVRAAGRTRSGKPIEPMAISVSPERYLDTAKVEKWFKRNCDEVLGRECTPREKGDWLAYMTSQ